MSHYQIITDPDALRDFIDWLPNLRPNEQYYLCLFARKKYAPGMQGIKTDKSQMKRFTSCKERMFNKIRQLECPIGAYTHRDIPIPQEALALYVSPSPRDLQRATIESLINLAKKVKDGNPNMNPHQEVMSTIQRTRSRKTVITFDIDSKDPAILNELRSISKDAVSVIETRGGYHFLVRPELMPEDNGQWYQQFAKYADIKGDALCPVVGTSQGGYTPFFLQKSLPFNDDIS